MDSGAITPARPHAGLARRFASLVYELMLLSALLLACAFVFLPLGNLLGTAAAKPAMQIYLVVVTAAYFVYCWTHGGQTLPMKTWRLKLVSNDGLAISTRLGLCRYTLALIGISFFGAGFIWAIFDRDKQFLHDRLLGTRLVAVT